MIEADRMKGPLTHGTCVVFFFRDAHWMPSGVVPRREIISASATPDINVAGGTLIAGGGCNIAQSMPMCTSFVPLSPSTCIAAIDSATCCCLHTRLCAAARYILPVPAARPHWVGPPSYAGLVLCCDVMGCKGVSVALDWSVHTQIYGWPACARMSAACDMDLH